MPCRAAVTGRERRHARHLAVRLGRGARAIARLATPCAAALALASAGRADAKPGMPDSIAVQVLAELPRQFTDRFVTGLARAGRGGDPARDSTVWFSPDGLHLAFLDEQPSGASVVVDGVAGPEYRRVHSFTFSRDGGHFAYFAGPTRDADDALVLDGREYPVDSRIEIGSPIVLSPDGARFAYVGIDPSEFRAASRFVVTEKERSRTYERVTLPEFSADGRRMGFLAHALERAIVVIDGIESPPYQWATAPVFSRAGHRVWHTFFDRGLLHLVRDGEVIDGYLGGPHFVASRDGARLGYVAEARSGRCVVVDGEAQSIWSDVAIDTSLFSADGRRTAYWARRGGTWTLLVDGVRVYEQSTTGSLPLLHWSADGAHIAHVERQRWSRRVVLDGVPGRDWDEVGTPRLSPRGGRLAYAARRGDREIVVVDGAEGPGFESVGEPVWSMDGAHVAYVAWKGRDRACVMLDGFGGPEFDVIVPGGPRYHADGTLEYLAIRGAELLRVRHAPAAVRP